MLVCYDGESFPGALCQRTWLPCSEGTNCIAGCELRLSIYLLHNNTFKYWLYQSFQLFIVSVSQTEAMNTNWFVILGNPQQGKLAWVTGFERQIHRFKVEGHTQVAMLYSLNELLLACIAAISTKRGYDLLVLSSLGYEIRSWKKMVYSSGICVRWYY